MIIDVLGTGESLSEYNQYLNDSIGVNNICAYHPVNILVLIDPPVVFRDKGTLDSIIEGSESVVFSSIPDQWGCLGFKHDQIQPLKLYPVRGRINFKDDYIPQSSNSTFVAAAFAFKLGADEIHLYGVDFNTHKAFGKHDVLRHKTALRDFKALYDYVTKKGVIMKTTKTSALSAFIPTINHERRNYKTTQPTF